MNTNWLTLTKEKRIEILNQVTEITGLPSVAIEKRLVGNIGIECIVFIALQ